MKIIIITSQVSNRQKPSHPIYDLRGIFVHFSRNVTFLFELGFFNIPGRCQLHYLFSLDSPVFSLHSLKWFFSQLIIFWYSCVENACQNLINRPLLFWIVRSKNGAIYNCTTMVVGTVVNITRLHFHLIFFPYFLLLLTYYLLLGWPACKTA